MFVLGTLHLKAPYTDSFYKMLSIMSILRNFSVLVCSAGYWAEYANPGSLLVPGVLCPDLYQLQKQVV